jgi:ApeA N-terminal domain 1
MSFNPTMLDSFELKGFWRLPSMERPGLRGRVTYSPEEGIQLTLEGSFESLEEGKPFVLRGNASVSYQTIHGITDEGKKVSVLEASGYPFPNLGPSTLQTYRAQWMVVDEHVPALGGHEIQVSSSTLL